MTTNYEEVLANLKKIADKFSEKLTDLNNQNNNVKNSKYRVVTNNPVRHWSDCRILRDQTRTRLERNQDKLKL